METTQMPLALVTCGPAYEPIDEVRRITNQSTGELGALLSEALARANFEVLCLRGQMAVYLDSARRERAAFHDKRLAAGFARTPSHAACSRVSRRAVRFRGPRNRRERPREKDSQQRV